MVLGGAFLIVSSLTSMGDGSGLGASIFTVLMAAWARNLGPHAEMRFQRSTRITFIKAPPT